VLWVEAGADLEQREQAKKLGLSVSPPPNDCQSHSIQRSWPSPTSLMWFARQMMGRSLTEKIIRVGAAILFNSSWNSDVETRAHGAQCVDPISAAEKKTGVT
jgi:hypothetical protein